jgi:immune inhibitor A
MWQLFFHILMFTLISLISCMPSGLAATSAGQSGEIGASAGNEIAPPPVTKLPSVAIGAIPPAGTHLVRPRGEVVERWLRRQGKIAPGMTREQVRSAVKSYFHAFSKKSSAWVSPEVQERALERSSESLQNTPLPITQSTTAACTAVQPVTAKIMVLAVDFGGTDTFTYSANNGSGCTSETVTTSGPRKGQIPDPGFLGSRDNNTIWYRPQQTANAKFYENLIFGHTGVGRVRLDLTDPTDGKPGINLNGYTVQDYYDHMAGTGNVVLGGTVRGWVRVNHSEAYYGAPNCTRGLDDGGGPATPAQLVIDALEKFKQAHPDYYSDTSPDAFWKQFVANRDPNNGKNYVSSLWIIHAGMGQEADGGLQGDLAIWSHSSSIRLLNYKVYEGDPGTPDDDIYIGPYTMQPENADLGVLVEEFGHNFFGFPDLYTNDIENSVGFWSIMSGGTWGGWLGGATPVGMTLWFRIIAQCGKDDSGNPKYCNWQEPMLTLPFNTPSSKVTLGQLESTPKGYYKGVKINLPDVVGSGAINRAGSGKGAYTGSGLDNLDITLDRKLSISKNGGGSLAFKTFWDIEEGDCGYVMIIDGNASTILGDLDGIMHETSLGPGLTGSGNQRLRFDLSPYRGKQVTLRLRYKTDASGTGAGWWVDDISLDGNSIDKFESATPPRSFSGWTNSKPGWKVVPSTQSYANFYLLEWRTTTKYDRMIKTAYVTNYSDEDEWQVERVPYNIPGAVLYYCNPYWNWYSYRLRTNMAAPPSIGPKYPLLVVDMNYGPLRLGDTGVVLDARRASYDAALTLQPTLPFTISQVDTGTGILQGPWDFPAKSAVTQFDDAKGYYAGLFAGSPCKDGSFCYVNEGSSAVIPAFGNYTTRITHYDGTPYDSLYGTSYQGSILGSGNPGDDGLQLGVRIKLLSKSTDGKTAKLIINGLPSQ